jgi:hypothetical protein
MLFVSMMLSEALVGNVATCPGFLCTQMYRLTCPGVDTWIPEVAHSIVHESERYSAGFVVLISFLIGRCIDPQQDGMTLPWSVGMVRAMLLLFKLHSQPSQSRTLFVRFAHLK